MIQKPDTYLGNNLVKRDGVSHEFTKHEISEYVKCMKDPIYFASNYIKVIAPSRGLVSYKPYPYQKKIIKQMRDNRFNIILACRQSGKCGRSDSYIYIKDKNTGKKEKITLEEFHERVKTDMPINNSGII